MKNNKNISKRPVLQKTGLTWKSAFSLIEIMVWIMIFLMWMMSVYAIMSSTMKLNLLNKDYIIATWLAQEQVELFRNIRDTNFSKIQSFKMMNPNWKYEETEEYKNKYLFQTWSYYKIENDFSEQAKFSVSAENWPDFIEGKKELIKNDKYKLCIDKTDNLYKFCEKVSDENIEKTPFYKYFKIEELKDKDGKIIKDALKVISTIVWNHRGYHKFEIKTIFTNYKIY